MESENKQVAIKVSYNQLYTSLKSCLEKLITTDKESFGQIDDKEKLIAFLKSDFKLGELKHLRILRKSKKYKDYIPLESVNDFKSLFRSLKVKNHIKLLINDSTPAVNYCQPECNGDCKKRSTIDFASLGKALVEASFTVLSDFRGEEFQAQAQTQTQTSTQPQPKSQNNEKTLPYSNCVHDHAACDSCNPTKFVPIKGVRFKCLVCRDYDLCEACELRQHIEEKKDRDHSFNHPMIKITRPLLDNRWNCTTTVSNNNNIIYDIPLNGCSLANKDKIESILREGNIDDFFKNVDMIIEESDRYKILASLLKSENNQEEDEDTIFAMLQSLIESSDGQNSSSENDNMIENFADQKTKHLVDIESSTLNKKDDTETSTNHSNKVAIYIKRYEPEARVISLILYNKSSYPISGGDLKFEFYDNYSSEEILVKNVRAISPGEKRSYNLGILTEKFNSLCERRLRISTADNIVMNGNYSPGEFTSLDIMNKPVLSNNVNKKLEIDLIEVVLVPKSSSMAQVIITNKSRTCLDCTNLKFKVINCFDQIVCDLSVVHGRTILPKRTAKYNIGLSNAHLKYPFKLIISTESFFASCDLSMKHLSGIFEVIAKKERFESSLIDDKDIYYPSSGTESFVENQKHGDSSSKLDEIATSGAAENTERLSSDKSIEGSTHFVVLPSLPKESLLESKNLSSSEYADAKSFLAHECNSSTDNHEKSKTVDDANDYDIISIGEDGEEIDSDFEVLSPVSSH